jgi:hypothetical protein
VVAAKYLRYVAILICLYAASSHADYDNHIAVNDSTHSAIPFNTQPATTQDVTAPTSAPANPPVMIAAAIGSEFLNKSLKSDPTKTTTLFDDENNLRLMEVHIGKYRFDDLLTAYQQGDILFIPLGMFSALIDLAITADTTTGIAQGFIFREDRSFYLDANRGEVTIAGKLTRFDKNRVAIRDLDDIYIDSITLSKWLPLTLDINLYASRLNIISDKPLPFELRKKREERARKVYAQADDRERVYPLQKDEYQQWSYPVINQTARAGFSRDISGDFHGTFGYSTYASADLLYMESAWYLAGTEEDFFEDARVTFARRDPSESLLGSAHATEYAFGFINEPRLEIITKPLDPQPGALISNYPLARQLQYDSQNFRGPLPPGWEVELYRNNELLGYIATSDNGLYQFDDVPLLFGTNYFRLVFYGPQGQVQEENYRYTLDRTLTRPGKHQYRALVSEGEEFGVRGIVQYEHGFSNKLSLAANVATIPLDYRYVFSEPEQQHNYLTAGARGFFTSMFYRFDFIEDMQSGSALDWEIQTSFRNLIFKIGETYFKNRFISEEFPETVQTIEHDTIVALDFAIPASLVPRIPITFDMERKQYEGGLEITRFGNRISLQAYGLSIGNTLNFNQQTGLVNLFAGNFQLSRRAFGFNFRGSASYDIQPESGLNAATFTMDGFRLWNSSISTGYSRVIQSDVDEVFFNINRSHGAYALGLNTRYSTGGILAVDLTFTMGLGREPRTMAWKPEYRPVATQGALSVQAFVDKNVNGAADIDEERIPNIKVRVNGGNIPQQVDNNGIVYITGVEPYRELDVELAVETLEDPLWQPSVSGKRIALRPGYVSQIDFPVVITGEIDGTAYIHLEDQRKEVAGVVIELLDLQGNVIKSVKTEYDGFYLIDKVATGKYQLRVSREQTDSLKLLPVSPTFVVVEPENPIVNGMDFVLQKQFNN